MTLQKNVKSHVFLDFEKNVKNVFSNYALRHGVPHFFSRRSTVLEVTLSLWNGHVADDVTSPQRSKSWSQKYLLSRQPYELNDWFKLTTYSKPHIASTVVMPRYWPKRSRSWLQIFRLNIWTTAGERDAFNGPPIANHILRIMWPRGRLHHATPIGQVHSHNIFDAFYQGNQARRLNSDINKSLLIIIVRINDINSEN